MMILRTFAATGILALFTTLTVGASSSTPAPIRAVTGVKVSGVRAVPTVAPPNDTVKITIPMHIQKVPNTISTFTLQCSFRYVSQPQEAVFGIGGPDETSVVQGGLSNGGYNGNITVTIKRDTTPPKNINGYFCDLFLPAGNTWPPTAHIEGSF
jgi:hypothetical protein